MYFEVKDSLKEIESYERLMLEMAQVGRFEDCIVFVRSNDAGKIPHFHVMDANTMGSQFHTCIRIDKPEYFHHEGKIDTFNSKEKKELIEFLNSQPRNKRYQTHWEMVKALWNDNNSDIEIDEDQPMPDYRELR